MEKTQMNLYIGTTHFGRLCEMAADNLVNNKKPTTPSGCGAMVLMEAIDKLDKEADRHLDNEGQKKPEGKKKTVKSPITEGGQDHE